MSGPDDVPEWARPLLAQPIVIDDHTTEDSLAEALAPRLAALMQLYNCDATHAGWRRLALRLALEHSIEGRPVLPIVTPADRPEGKGGAEPGVQWALAQRLTKRARELGSARAAADELARHEGLNPATLQNIAAASKAGRLKLPRWLQRLQWHRRVESALEAAAARLEWESQN